MVVHLIRHGSAVKKDASVSAAVRQDNDRVVETSIPARLDDLRWSGFHTRVVLALGITWILDGLEVTLAGALSGALKESPTLRFSNFDVGLANSAYLAGAVLGALGFGWLTDRIGRKKLFFITLAVYLTATAATALSWSVGSYALFRFLTGAGIEQRLRDEGQAIPDVPLAKVRLRTRTHTPLGDVVHTLIHRHRSRTLVALALMTAQAFFYNAIFFTYALVLTTFYGVPSQHVGWYILPFAAGNVLGPLLLGRLFDTIGRRPMIAFTYLMSGLLLALTGWLFANEMLSVREQTLAWSVIFFFASAAASAAYLTASETFPLEIRALAIAVFYAVGTGVGGVAGPMLFGALIDTGSRASLFGGYLLGAVLMIAAAAVMWRWGVAAERKPLEQVARPLAFTD